MNKLGIELEYMIVDSATLDISPYADKLFASLGRESRYENKSIHWSNELVNHVIELKVGRPIRDTKGAAALFQKNIAMLNKRLSTQGMRLLPSAAHPWMDPKKETELWPGRKHEVYEMFDRIFNCSQHGWANLQSMHLNFPFKDDESFRRLHTAIRLILPILPALCASSPIMDGKRTGYLDGRLVEYKRHTRKIPLIVNHIIPEHVESGKEYEEKILKPLYKAIRPYDPENILQEEWLNARGAIARFERNTIEIRVIDTQECPKADIAIAALVRTILFDVIAERWTTYDAQILPRDMLKKLLWSCAKEGASANVPERYAEQFGISSCTAKEFWRTLFESVDVPKEHKEVLQTIIGEGPLAQRIVNALGRPSKKRLHEVYARLADCLAKGELFIP